MLNKILLVEDYQTKADSIVSFLKQELDDVEVTQKESYKSALAEICKNGDYYDLILLDMSMTTFDVTAEESGGEPEPIAGQLILDNMYLRDIMTKVIVVTMYENFDGKTLNQLDQDLFSKYSDIYLGNIYFSFRNNGWKNNLLDMIRLNLNDNE